MHLAAALLLAALAASALARSWRKARATRGRPRSRPGTGAGWAAHRRQLARDRLNAEHQRIRDEARHRQQQERDRARHEYRMEEEAARALRTAGTAQEEPPRRRTVRSRVIRLGDPAPSPPSPEPPARDGAQPDAPRTGRPAPGPTTPPPGGTPVTTPDAPLAVPGVEPMINGAAALLRHAMSGGVQAKRRAVLGNAAALRAQARALRALATAMAEPGQHYGPEVWEPVHAVAARLDSAASALEEADARLRPIARTAEELRAAGVQAPHHAEMSETGSR